jgi:hypothetical protein
MHDVVQIETQRNKRKPRYDPNNTRIRELSLIARRQYADGHGDYVLPETPSARSLARALITHLARAGQRNGPWLFNLCRDRIPWLDPDDVDPARLIPDKAQVLGRKIGLTPALRRELHITSIAACDETPEQRVARRRERDSAYRRRRRAQAGGVTRAEWLTRNSLSRSKPWHELGISRRTYYRRRRSGMGMDSSDSPSQPGGLPRGTGVSPAEKIVAADGPVPRPADGPVSWRPRSIVELVCGQQLH